MMDWILVTNWFVDIVPALPLAIEPAVEEAFGDGAGESADNIRAAISGIIITFVIVWAAWLTYSQYQSFSNGEISFYDLMVRVLRAVIILLLFTVFIS